MIGIRRNAFTFEPQVASRFSYVDIENYRYYRDDNNAVSNTSGDASLKRFELGFGGFLTADWELGKNVNMTPRLGVMFYRDLEGDALKKDVTFAGDSYTLQGSSPERSSKEVTVGFDIRSGDHMTFSAGLVRVLKDDFYSNNYTLKFRYDF